MKKSAIILFLVLNLFVLHAGTRISILNASPPGIPGEQAGVITADLENLIAGNAAYTLIGKSKQDLLAESGKLSYSGVPDTRELNKICRKLAVKNILLWKLEQQKEILQLTIKIFDRQASGIRYNLIKEYNSFPELASGLPQVLNTILITPEYPLWSATGKEKKAISLHWGSELYSTPLLDYAKFPGLLLGVSVNLSYTVALVLESGFNLLSVEAESGREAAILGEIPLSGSLRFISRRFFMEFGGGVTFCDSTGRYKSFPGHFVYNTQLNLRGGLVAGRFIFFLEAGGMYIDQKDLQPRYGIGFFNLLF